MRAAAGASCNAVVFVRTHTQSSKTAPNIVSEWSSTRAATEQTMKLMQMYKDLGDYEGQVRGRGAGVR